MLRLKRHIGVSPTALRSLRARMELTIIEYQQRQNEVINKISSEIEICAAADETFFDQVILVMLDLPSGYIFVEEITENCQYETWQSRVAQAFKPLGLKVKYLVSDRAKAIIRLALNDLETNSISDLFHVLYDLNRSIGFELNCLGTRLEKQIQRALLNQSKLEIIQELEVKKQILQESKATYNHCCYSISTCLHPFDINYHTVQTTALVEQSLEDIQATNGLEFINTPSGYRKVFGKAASQGLGVMEYKPIDSKAISEVTALFDLVFAIQKTKVVTYG